MKTYITSFLMKVLCAVSVVFLLSAGVVSARSKSCSKVLRVIHEYGNCEGVESINLGPFLLGIAKMAASDEDGAEFMRYLDRMAVFSAEDASDRLKKDISDDLGEALKEYETAMEMKDGEDDMSVYFSKANGNVVREMVLVSRSEPAVILMIGHMPVAELEKIAAEASEQKSCAWQTGTGRNGQTGIQGCLATAFGQLLQGGVFHSGIRIRCL